MALKLDMPVWINIVSGLLALGLLQYLLTRDATPGMKPLRVLMASLAWWALFSAMELAVTDIPVKILLSQITYIGTVCAIPAWTLFALSYRGKLERIRKWQWLPMVVISFIMLVSVFTNEFHHGVWTTITPDPAEAGNRLIYGHGVIFYGFMVFSYGLMLFGSIVLVRASVSDKGFHRWQSALLVSAALFPLLGNLAYVLGVTPWPSVDLTPLMFTFTGFAFTLGILGFQMFKLLPVARDRLFDNLQDGVIVMDREGRLADMNHAAISMFVEHIGVTEWQGKHFDSLWPELSALVAKGGKSEFMPISLCSAEGNWLDVRMSGLTGREGRTEGVILTLRNITRLKEAEALLLKEKESVEEARRVAEEARKQAEFDRQQAVMARQSADDANQAKSTFLANLSHEMRTPLVALTGFLHLLSYTGMDRVQRQYVREIGLASESLLSLVNEILDFSRVEAGKLELERVPFHLDRVVEESASLLSVRITGKPINLAVGIETEPTVYEGDPGRIRQMVLNLLGNAVKFTARGEILVVLRNALADECDAIPESDGIRRIAIDVTDTGMGIPKEVQNKLFEPFTQADRSTARKYGGSGLGLAITRRMAELMGGRVNLSSAEGKGSRFTLVLPLPISKDALLPEERSPVDGLAGRSIMILGPWQTNRRILSGYLSKAGCRVMEVSTEIQMLENLSALAAVGLPDLLLIDDGHADLDGHAVRQRMMMDARLDGIRCILLVPPDAREDKRKTQDAIFSALMLKPVRRLEMIQLLQDVLAEHEMAAGRRLPERNAISVPGFGDLISPPEPGRESHSSDGESKNSLAGCHILLVEDTEANRRLMVILLEKFGCRVRIAGNGQEAVSAFEKEWPDIVLMDCQMPVMDGFEATRRIRLLETGEVHVPILAMTANDVQGEREACLEAGMDDFMAKPVSPQRLAAVLRQWRP